MGNKIKRKLIGFLVLAIVSIVVVIGNFNNSSKTTEGTKEETKTNVGNNSDIETKKENIIDVEGLPNEGKKEKTTIWIKNINILADKGISYSHIMNLKSKLNTELKTLDNEIYEVNLIEDTFAKTDEGFKVEAKADKLDGKIKVELKGYEYIFTIIY